MGEEKGGGYSNVAAVNAWNKAYQRSRTRRLLDDAARKKRVHKKKLGETITEICVSDKINDAEWVKGRLQKVLDEALNDDKYNADN